VFATLRAAISLIALIGFFVFAVALSAAVIFVGVVVAHVLRNVGVWIIVVGAIGALGVIVALVRMATFRRPVKPGVDVTAEDAPDLWALVAELSDSAGTGAPSQIRLTHETNAEVSEDARFFGLIGGVRRMYVGIPLLQGLTVSQLRAVLAHEFGHYSGAHTRLAPLAYRGWQGVAATVQQLRGNVIQWPLRFYAGLYFMMSLAMSRGQEREADRLMVKVAGRANAQASLREIYVIRNFWSAYFDSFLSKGWAMDLAPTAEGFFGGFELLLAARADERAEARRELELPAEGSLLDSHPPPAERVSAMEDLPDRPVPLPDDERPASVLISRFAALAAATAEVTFMFGYRERLDWDDFVARVFTRDDQRVADALYEAAARLSAKPAGSLETIVALSEAGRVKNLLTAAGSKQISDEVVSGWFIALVRDAVVRAGAARWRIPWSRAVELATPDGENFDAKPFAVDLAAAGSARRAAARLAALGVDLSSVRTASSGSEVDAGQIVAGISDMKSDGTAYDVLVLETGLVLAEVPNDSALNGFSRLDALDRGSSVAAMVARHRFIPFESIASAKVRDWFAIRATIKLRDGTTVRLREPLSSDRLKEDSNEVLKNCLDGCG
jgi:Zn-dependent protease with chaperone function